MLLKKWWHDDRIKAAPTSALPQLAGSSRRFLYLVAAIGLVVTLLQFILVHQQVGRFLAQRIEQPITLNISRLQ
ncbi:MAG: hypothetical protein HGA90_04340, partial [Alphaproteobacteria bacterium]|nr:hypothetical protein [Alphaproteobacteria bacterium]